MLPCYWTHRIEVMTSVPFYSSQELTHVSCEMILGNHFCRRAKTSISELCKKIYIHVKVARLQVTDLKLEIAYLMIERIPNSASLNLFCPVREAWSSQTNFGKQCSCIAFSHSWRINTSCSASSAGIETRIYVIIRFNYSSKTMHFVLIKFRKPHLLTLFREFFQKRRISCERVKLILQFRVPDEVC